jgi:hypothetical protein
LVEHNLAKVGVASSNLVSRSNFSKSLYAPREQKPNQAFPARWQSGYAADCNSVYAGSIPTRASIFTSFSLNTSIGCRMTVLILSLILSHQVFLHIPDSF